MAKCYKCGADIDADCLFCDQCGQVQYVCPNCHIVGKEQASVVENAVESWLKLLC